MRSLWFQDLQQSMRLPPINVEKESILGVNFKYLHDWMCCAGLPLFGRLLLRGAVKWTLRCRAPVLLKSWSRTVEDTGLNGTIELSWSRVAVACTDLWHLGQLSGRMDSSLVATCCLRHVKSLVFRIPAWGRHHATGMHWDVEGTPLEPMVRQKEPSFEHTLQGKRVRKWSM